MWASFKHRCLRLDETLTENAGFADFVVLMSLLILFNKHKAIPKGHACNTFGSSRTKAINKVISIKKTRNKPKNVHVEGIGD